MAARQAGVEAHKGESQGKGERDRKTGGGDRLPAAYSVKGKTAIITGAGSGINLAFASALLSRGCNVLLADLTLRPEAQALLDKYTPTSTTSSTTSNTTPAHPRALFLKTDVTQWSQLSLLFTTAAREFPSTDIVCPGAGIYDPHWSNFWHPPGSRASADDASGDRYASLDINLVHPLRTTQLAIAHFLNPKAGEGEGEQPRAGASPANPKRVVLVSSIAGQVANLHTPLYTAAKHGINGFIRSLGPLEARTGIRVNGVAPGLIRTPLWTDHPEKLAYVDEQVDEWATPEEVAEAMVRCLEEPGLVGGTILEVGAGQTRNVGMLNDPGPSGRGHTVSKLLDQYEEVYGWLGEEQWGLGDAKS